MGGNGSGEWYRWDKKTTTEESLSLDVNELAREGALCVGMRGTMSWTRGFTGTQIGALAFGVTGNADKRILRLEYRCDDAEECRYQSCYKRRGHTTAVCGGGLLAR